MLDRRLQYAVRTPGTTDTRRSRVRTLALAGIVGPICFTTLVIVQGILQPAYSHLRMPISALTAYSTGWIQILNFCVLGTLTAAFALALDRGVAPTRRGFAGTALLVLGGIGIILAGVFPWRVVNGEATATPLHVVAAITAFGATGAGFVVFSRRMTADTHWRSLAAYSLLTGIVILGLFVVIGRFALDDDAPLHPWAGLLQRVLCGAWFTCLILLALRLRRV